MIVYFAHPVSDYDTAYEADVLRGLRFEFTDAVNPNAPEHEAAYHQHGMAHFLQVCAGCAECFFSAFPGGIIGAGVAKEVDSFLSRGAPVWQIMEPGSYVRLLRLPPWVADVATTRALVGLYRAMPNGGRGV